jgi:hypothetical protein
MLRAPAGATLLSALAQRFRLTARWPRWSGERQQVSKIHVKGRNGGGKEGRQATAAVSGAVSASAALAC